MKFVEATREREARTANNMKARATTANANVDLFYKIGASRGKDITPDFAAAFAENTDYALRIAQWARDVRGGAGERQIYRDVLSYLVTNDLDAALRLIKKTPTIGRWDDVWSVFGLNSQVDKVILSLIADNIESDGLLCKWLPRKKYLVNGVDFTAAVRNFLGLTPKQYRKLIVNNTNVVETKMCNKEFDTINFAHVPSVAHNRYRRAFGRNANEEYVQYLNRVESGEEKVNAGAVYPYEIVKRISELYSIDNTEKRSIVAQWEALPNYLGEEKILPMVDVSGSMTCRAGRNTSVTCMDVAVSLGMYLADKNSGDFADCFLTFSGSPELQYLKGDIFEKYRQISSSKWGMNTDLHRAVAIILTTALNNNVAPEDMPDTLLILSDMQFDSCTRFDDSAMEMMRRKYEEAGYELPKIVFWNLNAYGNTPVRYNESGVALVSGFSPSILKSILAGKDFTPQGIMLEAIMNPRYDV